MVKGEIMPQVGEIKTAKELGKKGAGPYILHACEQCGKQRWIHFNRTKAKPASHKCYLCGHKRNPKTRQKGDKIKQSLGYILVYMPDHPFAQATGYILEHRLKMEEKLGRYLLPSEMVHHINGIKGDNRIGNLMLIAPSDHGLYNKLCRNCQLRKEIRLLRWQGKELQKTLQLKLEELQ